MGLAHGWNVQELNRAPGEVFVGLSALPPDSIVTIDLDTATPDETENPDAVSLGYTTSGWTGSVKPTFDSRSVDEEETPVATTQSGSEVTLAGAIRQVKNLARLALITPGSVYTPPTGGVEKLTGGGLKTFSYTSVVLVWQDENDANVVYCFGLYRAVNTGDIGFRASRTADSEVNVNFTGYADSSRNAGDRIWYYAKIEAAGS